MCGGTAKRSNVILRRKLNLLTCWQHYQIPCAWSDSLFCPLITADETDPWYPKVAGVLSLCIALAFVWCQSNTERHQNNMKSGSASDITGINEILKAEKDKKGLWKNLPIAFRRLFSSFKGSSVRRLIFFWCSLLDCSPMPDTHRISEGSNLNIGKIAAHEKEKSEQN